MRVEITYYAIDDTEFDTKEDCEAYEKALEDGFKSIVFFDEDMNPITSFDPERISTYAFYMGIRDADNAYDFIRWLYGYAGMNMDGIPENLTVGDVYAWDNDEGEWRNPMQKLRELQATVDKIEKAVGSMG